MKTALKTIVLIVTGFALASCCGNRGTQLVEETKTTYVNKVVTVNPGGKGALPYTKTIKVPVTTTVFTKKKCKCTSSFNPKGGCCGELSKKVTQRATTQGSTGEPFIGLIPTMKTLISVE